jgi:hypothetical protein
VTFGGVRRRGAEREAARHGAGVDCTAGGRSAVGKHRASRATVTAATRVIAQRRVTTRSTRPLRAQTFRLEPRARLRVAAVYPLVGALVNAACPRVERASFAERDHFAMRAASTCVRAAERGSRRRTSSSHSTNSTETLAGRAAGLPAPATPRRRQERRQKDVRSPRLAERARRQRSSRVAVVVPTVGRARVGSGCRCHAERKRPTPPGPPAIRGLPQVPTGSKAPRNVIEHFSPPKAYTTTCVPH